MSDPSSGDPDQPICLRIKPNQTDSIALALAFVIGEPKSCLESGHRP
jgi:hypothetical protein